MGHRGANTVPINSGILHLEQLPHSPGVRRQFDCFDAECAGVGEVDQENGTRQETDNPGGQQNRQGQMLQSRGDARVREEDGVGLCGGVCQDGNECPAVDAEGHGGDRPS